MFESAELGHKITKQIYARQEPKLREALLNAQFDLAQAKKFPVLILIGGVDGAGKGETVNLLNEWMDPRHIQTRAFGDATDEEAERPRIWRELPPKGKIGIMFGSWYTAPIGRRVLGQGDDAALKGSLEEIVRFEKMLCDEGVLLLKFWFHLSRKQQKERVQVPPLPEMDNLGLLRDLDMTQKVTKEKYETQLEKWQGRLNLLSRDRKYFKKHSLILLFEGSDAAGKGGAIRRITGAIDARHFQVVPVAAPTEEERAQPYLWRFWRHAPRRGRITIFDRSWYGRVLVERVEGFCGVADWMRAHGEINDFEEQLARGGAIVCKFWLQITAEEQLKRFTLRQKTSFKRFKITEEDWRNRKKWGEYEQAVCDMIDRTSTDIAPWTVVEAEDKYFARVKILRTIVERMEHN